MNNIERISIIIPTLNEEEYLPKCLNAISCLRVSSSLFEIIVVDNGSQDRTLEKAKKFGVKILSRPGMTISELRNSGAKCATGSILAFLDADCIIPETWLRRILFHFTNGNIAALGGGVRCSNDSSWVAKTWDLHRLRNYYATTEAEYLPSGNLVIRKKVFDSLNGFDERLRTNEDYELSHRMREKAYRILSDPDMTCIHLRTTQTIWQFIKKEMWHGKDVFRVFISDISKAKNWRSVLYAIYWAICIVGILVSIPIVISSHDFTPLAIGLCILFMMPSAFSLKVVITAGKPKYFCALTILYIIYGCGRAICLMNLNSWVKNKSSKD